MNNSSDDSIADREAYYDNIYNKFYFSHIWVLLAFGVPGNIACIITVSTMTVSTATLYVVLLAATDLLATVLKVVFRLIEVYDVPQYTVGCKADVLASVVSSYANWTLVLICFERFLAVCYPLQRNAYFTKRKAVVIAVCLGLFLLLCYLHDFIHKEYTEGYCYYPSRVVEFMTNSWIWIVFVLYFLLPFILLSIFTCIIVVSLRRQRKERERIMAAVQGPSADTSHRRSEQTICVMMVSAAIVFLVLTLPTCVYHFLLAFKVFKDDTLENLFVWYMTQIVSINLSEANHAVNFYVYFLSAKRFRSRFRELGQTCFKVSMKKVSETSATYEMELSSAQAQEKDVKESPV